MRYWWVNHKQTGKQEVAGGYLWSPKVERSGARSQFYDNMTRAEPGDRVFSYIAGQIGYVGVVVDAAITSKKPAEFGKLGDAWSSEGWNLAVNWQPVVPAFIPKAHLDELLSKLPLKYSPLSHKTGRGNQKAYLSEVPKSAADFILAHMEASPVGATSEALADRDYLAEYAVWNDISLNETVKEQVVKARRGQGLFRKAVMAREKTCRVTGLANPDFLIASHIKPWRDCEAAEERLSGANGLMLCPNADRLFDQHLISFQDDGTLLVSPNLSEDDCEKLGLTKWMKTSQGMAEGSSVWGTEPFADDQVHFMSQHRARFFKSASKINS